MWRTWRMERAGKEGGGHIMKGLAGHVKKVFGHEIRKEFIVGEHGHASFGLN